MYKVKPLEEEWKRYKAKKRKPLYFALVFIFLILFLFYYQNNRNIIAYLKQIENVPEMILKTNKVEKNTKNILVNNALERLELSVLETNIENMNNDVLVDIPILNVIPDSSKKNDSPIKSKVYLDIIETSSLTAYEDVEKRFLQSRDIDDALFLAKSYYKKGNYEKSSFWAYEVNKLDNNLEESLFIFVESKVNLGQSNEAISILKTYISTSNSEKAKILLNKIEDNVRK